MNQDALPQLPDDELLRRLRALVRDSRRTEAELVAHIGEVDARRLYAREACPSMFAYCVERLHLSDAEAYFRIAAARAARRCPLVLSMLADGRLHLSAIVKLAPHLTADNCEAVLARAVHRTKREIENLAADLSPQPASPPAIRKLPVARGVPKADPTTAVVGPCPLDAVEARPRVEATERQFEDDSTPAHADRRAGSGLSSDGGDGAVECPAAPCRATPPPAPVRPATVEPLGALRYRVQFTASAALRHKLERLQALMRRSVPDGDLAVLIEEAVTEKLERLEARRFGVTAKERSTPGVAARRTAAGALAKRRVTGGVAEDGNPLTAAAAPATACAGAGSSRHVPAAIRRAVRERDGDRCRFVDAAGRRCSARHDLEFHHRHPFAYGGGHTVDNISLVCRTHNLYLAEADYAAGLFGRSRAQTPEATASSA